MLTENFVLSCMLTMDYCTSKPLYLHDSVFMCCQLKVGLKLSMNRPNKRLLTLG